MLRSPEWHLLIVWYFFLGGIAGGAYFTAAVADNFGSPRDRNVVRIGYILALLMIGICGLLLILDLGTPSRFLNMVGTFKFWDPMSIGAWMLGLFGLFAFVSSALSLSPDESRAALRRKRGKEGRFDSKGTMRANQRYGGVPMELKFKRKKLKPSLVLICDISRSMLSVAEFMLRLTYELQDQVAKTRSLPLFTKFSADDGAANSACTRLDARSMTAAGSPL